MGGPGGGAVTFPGSDVPCACGHLSREHAPDCMAVIDTDTFCTCSGYRTDDDGERTPELTVLLRAQLYDKMLPDWTAEARCRSAELPRSGYFPAIGPNTPGNLWKAAYGDDVADTAELELTQDTLDFMHHACLPCPVRLTCLAYAYAEVDRGRAFGVFGGVPGRIREHAAPAAADGWFAAFVVAAGWITTQEGEAAHG